MSSPGQESNPASTPQGDGHPIRLDVPGDLSFCETVIDLTRTLDVPLQSTLAPFLLSIQLGAERNPDMTVLDLSGHAFRIGDVIDPENVRLPTNNAELEDARTYHTVRGLARLSFDLSMQSVPLLEMPAAAPETANEPNNKALQPDQLDEFYSIYEQNNGSLRAYLASSFSNLFNRAVDVDDVLQECWTKAMASWNSFTPGTNRTAWLRRIASNTAISVWRSLQVRREDSVDPTVDEYLLGANDQDRFGSRSNAHIPNSRDELEEASVELARKLLGLGVKNVFVPVMVATEGLDLKYEQTATELHIAVGSVKSRVHRGRRALRTRVLSDAASPNSARQNEYLAAASTFGRVVVTEAA